MRLEETFRQDSLQVVVEISNIELTPGNPIYSGEAHFHIYGLRNDRITATNLFVVEARKITQPHIAFEHENKVHLDELECKIPDTLATVQDIDIIELCDEKAPWALHTFGSVPLTEGRLLSCPSIFQPKQESFRLADPGQPRNRYQASPRRSASSHLLHAKCAAPAARQAVHLDKCLPPELVQLVMEQTEYAKSRSRTPVWHERTRTVIYECVGHHYVRYIDWNDIHAVRDATIATESDGYESP